MRVFKKLSPAIRHLQTLTRHKDPIGFVPTMGALHEGHLSLIRKSRRENAITVVSIFVNPAQFGPHEDFRRYPRPIKKDIFLLQSENPDIIICPSSDEMYPDGFKTFIEVKGLGEKLCGRSRPGHFRGVTTVVCKFLNIVRPNHLYLGQKDAQQIVIIRKMIADLNLPVKVKIGSTVRDSSGLALSSRNQYLNETQRREASALYRALRKAKKTILSGERNPDAIVRQIYSDLKNQTSCKIEYIECVDSQNLEPFKILAGEILIAMAVYFGQTRLIDNMIIRLE